MSMMLSLTSTRTTGNWRLTTLKGKVNLRQSTLSLSEKLASGSGQLSVMKARLDFVPSVMNSLSERPQSLLSHRRSIAKLKESHLRVAESISKSMRATTTQSGLRIIRMPMVKFQPSITPINRLEFPVTTLRASAAFRQN